MKKCCLYPLSQYILVLASEALKKGRKTFVTVFLVWSETVSVINLQILKSILKSAQKCAIFTFKIQKFSGEGPSNPTPLCPLSSPPLANTSGSATASNLQVLPLMEHSINQSINQSIIKVFIYV